MKVIERINSIFFSYNFLNYSVNAYLSLAASLIICLVFSFYFIKINSCSAYFYYSFCFVFYKFCLLKKSYFSNNDIFSLYDEIIPFLFLIAYTCIEEMFMSGNSMRDCCLDEELSSSFET